MTHMKIKLYTKKTGNFKDYYFKLDNDRSRAFPGKLDNPIENLAYMLKHFYKDHKSEIDIIKNLSNEDKNNNKKPFTKKEYDNFIKYLNK